MKIIVLSIIACTLMLQFACSPKKEEKQEIARYAITSPLIMDTTFTKEYVSQIKSFQNIEIRAQEKGFLQQIYVDEGQFVKAGQLLFRIMPKIYEAEYQKAEAEAKVAEIELQNTRSLVDKDIVSKNEQALAQARLDHANAEKALAKLHLSFTEIRAPFNGTIDRIPKKLGSLIDEGELLTNLSDNRQVFAYFNVSEPEYLDYQTNTKNRGSNTVNLLLANNQLLPNKGLIETIESEFDSETGNIAFRAKFPNPDKLLRNGETGKVLMTLPLTNALVIPQKATYETQDQKYVFIIDKEGVARSKNIQVAYELPDLYVISAGLSQGDKILLEGVQKVKDDQKIQTKFEDPAKVLLSLKLNAE
ncbi:efflux RND transporter periplasmic adaptor subunit [Sphingobacterium sp. SYP-B4668]|uniref:efflux RND transporter periplasmic adaptor subunit n=1 Tax=Sphingobacterium sp. SYP-B4668 TaxID=2996035 RepID=UPI0022DE2DF7|nr:efflux RND transporter periplasmic adaptor subunit [Sphingobacterium sp. SYP-B4668]